MTRLLRLLVAAALLSLAAIGVSAPTIVAGDPCYHSFEMPAPSVGEETQIKVASCAFSPTVTKVATGATVTFFNGPDFIHLVTGANQAWGSRDVELAPGQTVSYKFDKPGLYPYACALHRGMSGVIVVGDVAKALAAAPTGGGAAVSTPTTGGTTTGATTGGTDGTTTGGTGTSTTGSANQNGTPNAAPVASTSTGLSTATIAGIAIASAVAGLIGGAAAVWIGLRRRPSTTELAARPD